MKPSQIRSFFSRLKWLRQTTKDTEPSEPESDIDDEEEAYKDDMVDQEITDQENLRKDVVKEISKTKPKRPLSEAGQTESSQKTQKK
ncbi:unnamed protein product [Didymodactylos carnosus]|uniref:Uncharacterized protein n=1 Tax=Didymodactylos carnosus TaxID=1234261 RepID=A0A815UBT0_9BILA|nr:unnamed protein product [Didymodactylos carnosus]CAF1514769.1 unnamed protein product [Didymodactylos carnosus]CAF4195969.1 unnamed protein product [Didymodactylos carnosus]CAF4374871.1 unnamed protein product [Didymodactylos carnosus]